MNPAWGLEIDEYIQRKRINQGRAYSVVMGGMYFAVTCITLLIATRVRKNEKEWVSPLSIPRPLPHIVWYGIFGLGVLLGGCGGAGGDNVQSSSSMHPPPQSAACSVAQLEALEAKMDAQLSQADSEVDFSFAVQRKDGRRYTYNRGSSTLQTVYESASASKLVAAVIVMRMVEQGYLSLTDRPQDHISAWPIPAGESMYDMTLTHLLSMTSGLTSDPPCVDAASADFEACVLEIATSNARGFIPGEQFVYVSAHHQVAGLMAVKARGVSGWNDLFTEFKAQTGLFAQTNFDLPSVSNPLLGGGMHVTGEDYMDFLKALQDGAILNAASMAELLTDRTASATIVYSPIMDGIHGGPGLGEDWHYGFGLWHECRSAQFNCVPGSRISSPGTLGSYPFWDRIKGYAGIVIRQGVPGSMKRGIDIERSVRPQVEEWSAC